MLKGFKQFIMRGNVLDLAVGLVMGTAFTAVVNGLLNGIINPMIAAIFGQPDISNVGHFVIRGATFSLGTFLQALLTFLMTAAGLYFLVVLPVAKFQKLHPSSIDPADNANLDAGTREVALLSEIRDLLRQDPAMGKHAQK